MGSGQTIGNSDSSSKIMCRRKLETLYSEARNSSTTSENTQYGTEENKTGKIKQMELYLAHFNYSKSKEENIPSMFSISPNILNSSCRLSSRLMKAEFHV